MIPIMAYDHSTKIGNQGDLVKHVALLSVLRHLSREWPSGREFVYADLHSGRPEYELPSNGQWRRGVGLFSKALHERLVSPGQSEASLAHATAFQADLFRGGLREGSRYLGSSGIAHRLLSRSGLKWRMELWEKNVAAADDLIAHFGADGSHVRVVVGNGYEAVQAASGFGLVLIDPPALETKAVLAAITALKCANVPFICWTPRTSRSVKPKEPEGSWTAAESARSIAFFEAACKVGSCFRIRWYRWGHRTPGCCITVSEGLSDIVAAALRETLSVMGWELGS
ncbi:MAG: 23S rRNA (adenine(2030)-N(6))-methyltransferase RlmJ [Polyangiaceae bacterium]